MTAMAKRIVILGALSAIAEAAARPLAESGARFMLTGRDATRLGEVAADLRARGATAAHIDALDLAAEPDPAARLKAWSDQLGGIGAVILAYGALGEASGADATDADIESLVNVNFTSAARWAQAAADLLEAQGDGSLVVIGSVAGDRGRARNYVYAAAKAGVAAFVQGLAHRLSGTGARAVLVKPGFVDTPMTEAFAGTGPLWSKPRDVASAIGRALRGGGPIVYAPGYWRYLMLAVRALPAAVVHRTSL